MLFPDPEIAIKASAAPGVRAAAQHREPTNNLTVTFSRQVWLSPANMRGSSGGARQSYCRLPGSRDLAQLALTFDGAQNTDIQVANAGAERIPV
jgi:hypothetical protein